MWEEEADHIVEPESGVGKYEETADPHLQTEKLRLGA
jgi:hypothetical protein